MVKRLFWGTELRTLASEMTLTVLLTLGSVGGAGAADLSGALPVAARETGVSEVLALRTRAERGDVAAQMTLGDLFSSRQQFGEAIYWYRVAATNGEVTAQLALAGCLIAGRGEPENRQEAARWMRLAADGVENSGVATTATGTRVVQDKPLPQSIILTRSNAAPAAVRSAANTNTASVGAKNLFTIDDSHSTRATRDDKLSAVEPRLQERNVGLQPSAAPK